NGIIYTYGDRIRPSDLTNSPRVVVKSTDNGLTWSPDTAGLSTISMNSWFVDENGTQHASKGNVGAVQLYSKTSGGSWAPDMMGFASTTNEQATTCWGTDNNGTIYVGTNSTQGKVLWKKTGTSSWILDTTGLHGSSVFSIA